MSAPTDAEQLARLRVARATGVLPPDLGDWVLDRVTVSRTARRREVAGLLRRAAALIPGTSWAKARALQHQIRAVRAAPETFAPCELPLDTAPGLVLLAVRIAPDCPTSVRQLLRIIEGTDG